MTFSPPGQAVAARDDEGIPMADAQLTPFAAKSPGSGDHVAPLSGVAGRAGISLAFTTYQNRQASF